MNAIMTIKQYDYPKNFSIATESKKLLYLSYLVVCA